MGREHHTVTSSLCLIVVITKKHPTGFHKGYVENLSINQSYNTEIVRGVGRQWGVENVSHGIVQCDISWGETHTYDQNNQASGVVPESTREGLAAHDVCEVLFYNADRGEFLARALGVLGNQLGLTTGAQASVKENFSGTGIKCLFREEQVA